MAYNLRTEQGRQDLEIVTKEKDLDVIVINDLKPSIQCAEAARSYKCSEINKRFLFNHQGKFYHPIQHLCQTLLGILCPSMETLSPKRH